MTTNLSSPSGAADVTAKVHAVDRRGGDYLAPSELASGTRTTSIPKRYEAGERDAQTRQGSREGRQTGCPIPRPAYDFPAVSHEVPQTHRYRRPGEEWEFGHLQT